MAKKDKRLTSTDPETVGSQWIFIAMDRNSKLIPAFALGKRTTEVTHQLMRRLQMVQLRPHPSNAPMYADHGSGSGGFHLEGQSNPALKAS